MLRITEIFKSIQGESTYQGWPCGFIRLTGCNLRCSYCDTTYAYEGGELMTVEEILNKVACLGVSLIEVTGGEPLLQEETVPLIEKLLDRSYRVLVETNGSLDGGVIPEGAVRVLDIKCPGSGENDKIFWKNLNNLRPSDEVKFVLSNRADYDWALDVVHNFRLNERVTVLLSPVHGCLSPRRLAEWVVNDDSNVRLNIQLHKILWGSKRKGV